MACNKKFLIITHVPHGKDGNQYFAYAPYVREMNIWEKYVDEVLILAPINPFSISAIDSNYEHTNIRLFPIEKFDFLSFQSSINAMFKIPKICWQIFKAMKQADHIHLRCPGNVGLLGCLVQIFFPKKIKTAKYAGNWDPNSKQPWTYKLQQKILSNTFLTRNMQVLVYGEWERMTQNIKPFFTATYKDEDKTQIVLKELKGKINFIFVGTLVKGKNPLYAIKLVEKLSKKGFAVSLNLYGEGVERNELTQYVLNNNLESKISFKGNQMKDIIQNAYQESHFVILPSESEGWPKAIAEGMFWGCVPIATKVSCVPYMLDNGARGVLLDMYLDHDVEKLFTLINDNKEYNNKQTKAANWSRSYTIDVFEEEIKKLL